MRRLGDSALAAFNAGDAIRSHSLARAAPPGSLHWHGDTDYRFSRVLMDGRAGLRGRRFATDVDALEAASPAMAASRGDARRLYARRRRHARAIS